MMLAEWIIAIGLVIALLFCIGLLKRIEGQEQEIAKLNFEQVKMSIRLEKLEEEMIALDTTLVRIGHGMNLSDYQ